MKEDEIIKTLREEAQQHIPDVRERVIAEAARKAEPQGEVLAVSRKKRVGLMALLGGAVCILLAVILLLLLLPAPGGGGPAGSFKIVISVEPNSAEVKTLAAPLSCNVPLAASDTAEPSVSGGKTDTAPGAEFTLENGKVSSTRALNRYAAVLMKDVNFTGDTAEEACLRFTELADGKQLIGAGGVRLRIEGGDPATLDGVRGALSQRYTQYSFSDMDDASFDALFAGYDEGEMGEFEDWLEREFEGRRSGFEEEVRTLIESGDYPTDLETLDKETFNRKYQCLGEDLIFEDGDETRRELLEEYEELCSKWQRSPERVLDELFEEFMDEIEDVYEDIYAPDDDDGRKHIGDDDDDEDDDDDDEDDDDDDDDDDDRDDD